MPVGGNTTPSPQKAAVSRKTSHIMRKVFGLGPRKCDRMVGCVALRELVFNFFFINFYGDSP